MLKVLHVVPSVGSVYGGSSKAVLELVGVLGSYLDTVHLVTTNANGSERLDVPLHDWIQGDNYQIQYFPYLAQGDYKFSRAMSHWLWDHVGDYDLVHTHAVFSIPNWPAYWSCQRQGIPYVVSPHGMLQPWTLSYKAWKKKFFYRLLEKPALDRCCGVHALTRSEAEGLHNLGLNVPLFLLPNGIHRQEFEVLPDAHLFYEVFPHTQGRTLILFLGRIDPKKGLDLLVPAFAQALKQYPESHLVIAGPDNIGYQPSVEEYIRLAGCGEAVTFTGMLAGDLKLSALAAADIFVAPSYSEGFSMSVLEGMAAGLPCVITTGCNFPEAAQAKAALMVNPNCDQLLDALIACLSDRPAAAAMGERAQQLIFEQYTWNHIAHKLAQVYQAIHKTQPLPHTYAA